MKVADLAQATEDKEYPFASTGKKDFAEGTPIKLDKGTYKGKLHFLAEFIPALQVKNMKFNTGSDELKNLNDSAASDGDGDTVRSDNESMLEALSPIKITVTEPVDGDERLDKKDHRTSGSEGTVETSLTQDSMVSAKSGDTSDTSLDEQGSEQGVELTKDELLRHRAYILREKFPPC